MAEKRSLRPIAYYRERKQSASNLSRALTAKEAIGAIDKERGFTILTNGAFSMIDAVYHVLSQTGKAKVWITTWVPGERELVDLYDLWQSGDITEIKFLLDYGYCATRAESAELLLSLFGAGNVFETRNHAKFVLIRNEEWDYCLRGSLNLNGNFRCENLDGDNDAGMCDAFERVFMETATRLGDGVNHPGKEVGIAWRKMMLEAQHGGKKNKVQRGKSRTDMSALDGW